MPVRQSVQRVVVTVPCTWVRPSPWQPLALRRVATSPSMLAWGKPLTALGGWAGVSVRSGSLSMATSANGSAGGWAQGASGTAPTTATPSKRSGSAQASRKAIFPPLLNPTRNTRLPAASCCVASTWCTTSVTKATSSTPAAWAPAQQTPAFHEFW